MSRRGKAEAKRNVRGELDRVAAERATHDGGKPRRMSPVPV
jgi:hypothetical protein